MAPKRTAAKSPPRAAKSAVAKKAKVVADPFLESLEPAFALMDEDESLTDTARAMLRASAPFALRLTKSDRHTYQAGLVDCVANLLQKVEARKKEAMETEQDNLAKVEADKAATASALVDTGAKESECLQLRDVSNADLKKAGDALAAAKLVHAAAIETVGRLETENEQTVAEKAAREKFIEETWGQLKTSSLPGRMWRTRDKLIDSVIEILTARGAEVSCMQALAVALKEKPEQRGPIGSKCIEFVEKHLSTSVNELSEKIAGHANNVAEKTRATEDAAAKVKEAENANEEKQNSAVDAENALLEASEAHKANNTMAKDLAALATQLTAALSAVKEDYDEAKAVRSCFDVFVEHGETGVLTKPAADDELEPAPALTTPAPEAVEEGEASKPLDTKVSQEVSSEMAVEA